jgi:hypothetical protein
MLLAIFLVAGVACRHEEAASAPAQTFTISLATPPDVPITAVALGADHGISLGVGVRVQGLGSVVPAFTNLGSQGVRVGADAVAGDIWSASAVSLGDRAQLVSVHAADVTRGANVVMASPMDTSPKLTPPKTITWKVDYPTGSPSKVIVDGGKESVIPPGQYGSVEVPASATLILQTGTYLLDSLVVNAGAKVVLNQGNGPVAIYARGAVKLHGTIESSAGAPPDLLVGYFGASDLLIDAPLTATIVSTQGKVVVSAPAPGFVGAVFAPSIQLADGVSMTFAPANAVLKVGGVDLGQCLAMIAPRSDVNSRQNEIQYQEDILRYCTGGGLAACEATLYARTNVDFFAAAQAAIHGTIQPAQYAAFVRDREAKLAALRDDEQAACAVVADDPDDDFVPTFRDACPQTPDFTPTLANGCTDTNIPPGPSSAELRQGLGDMGISTDPRCTSPIAPPSPAPLGAWRYPPDPSVGKAIWVSRFSDSSGCPLYYELEAELTDGHTSHIAVKPAEDTSLTWITRPAGVVQLNIKTGDGGDRGAWASYSVYTVRYRARALSGSGRRSDWSEWFSPGHEDCVAGTCGD